MSYECCYISGKCDHAECGEWWFGGGRIEQQPEPTIEEYCNATDHALYGWDGEVARCYCGHRIYYTEELEEE